MQTKQSILQAKAHKGTPQQIFVLVKPDPAWLETSPHKFEGDAEVSGTITFENDEVFVDVSIRVPMQYVCDKCGVVFSKNLLANTSATYSEIGEYETPSDIDMDYKIVSNNIDLQPLVRDAVFDNMPSQVLCNKNCKGLCPICGENLNFSSCRCKKC